MLCFCYCVFLFYCLGAHRDLHCLTRSFPTRRSSDLPAVGACLQAQVRADRAIAELRCIEALRMYAASHGRWPKTLGEIKDVPVPNDPVTGEPFEIGRAHV